MSLPDTDVDVRRATSADLPALAALLAAGAPGSPKADPGVLAWQYPSLDDPDAPGSWVVTVRGEVVAHSGGIPMTVVHDGRRGTGVFGADAATHPAHRRQGHFAAAARARVAEAHRLGALVSWSVPRPAAVPGLTAAGLRAVGRGRLRWSLVLAGRVARRWSGDDPSARVVADPLPAVERLGRAPAAGVVRDTAWWRWRYLDRPGGAYVHLVVEAADDTTGVAVATVVRRRGVPVAALCDWHVTHPRALRALLVGAASHLPVAAVAAITLQGSRTDRQLADLGARPLPRALEPQPLTVLADRDLGLWQLSWGELDWV